MVLVKSALAGFLALIAAFAVLLMLVMLGLFIYGTFHQTDRRLGRVGPYQPEESNNRCGSDTYLLRRLLLGVLSA
jgi:hypothetical protein